MINIHKSNPDINILSVSYSLGWGIENEAGIMICFGIPLIIYELIKSKNSIISLFCVLKLSIAILGMILTNSRGTLVFGLFETAIFIIIMIFFSKKRITNFIFTLLMFGLIILYVYLYYNFAKLFSDIKEYVFYNGFDNNGRLELWNRSFNLWNSNWRNRLFGSGIVSEIEYRQSFNGFDNVFIVYHSTFFEVLAIGGGFGVLAILFHFFEKYKQICKKELSFALIMIVGYLAVDFYGMIDNTYGMYYYMVPLILIMAVLDNDYSSDIFANIIY